MSTTNTTNYSWAKPDPGTESGTWGNLLNTIFDNIDTEVKNRENEIDAVEARLANPNLIINGNFEIDQRNVGSITGVANGQYMADRFKWVFVGAGVVDYAQSSTTPNDVSQNSLQIDVTTADASITAADIYYIEYNVEGYDYFSIHNGEDVCLSFWVRSPKTGTHCVSFQNSAQNRSRVQEYTINTANTFEKKTIPITTDTSGTWLFTNGIGLKVNFVAAAGTNFHGTAGTWNAADDRATVNQVNAMDNVANNFHISQIKLERGTVTTNFETSINIFETEFEKCLRYYHKTYDLSVAPATVTTTGELFGIGNGVSYRQSGFHSTPMRATGTAIIYSPATGAANVIREDGLGADVAASASTRQNVWGASSGSLGGGNPQVRFHLIKDTDF